MRKLLLLTLTLALTISPGCVFDVGRFTIISNQNVEVSRIDLAKADLQRGVTGSDGTFWFLFVPFGSLPSVDRAMDEALRAGWGDFMLNCQVQRVFWTTLIFSWTSYRVLGDVGNSVGKGSRQFEDPLLYPAPAGPAATTSPVPSQAVPAATAPTDGR